MEIQDASCYAMVMDKKKELLHRSIIHACLCHAYRKYHVKHWMHALEMRKTEQEGQGLSQGLWAGWVQGNPVQVHQTLK